MITGLAFVSYSVRDVPAAKFVAPPESGLALARGYPLPMVDHAMERDHALEMYRT